MEATKLSEEKRFAEACDKFAASQTLDPGLGTLLYLADCYERTGKTASAWALFREAADTAERAGQLDRQRIASERANALEPKLSKLELRVELKAQPADYEVRVNAVRVPNASLNSAWPVDPGPTHIEARAPGRQPWMSEVTIGSEPSTKTVELPVLVDLPEAASAPASAARGANVPERSRTQATVGYVLGAVGVVALVVGGYFGYRAYAKNKDSKEECRAGDENACTEQGVSLRDDARTAGTLSTIGVAAGGVLVAGGLTLVLTAPSAGASEAPRTSARAERAPLGLGLSLGGVW